MKGSGKTGLKEWKTQCDFQKKIEKDAVNNMNNYIYKMIAEKAVLMEIVIKGKADHGQRAFWGVAYEWFQDVTEGDLSHPDMGVFSDTSCTIKKEGEL